MADPVLRHGVEQAKWPGRLEVVSDSPMVILDGAHNLAAARNLAKYLAGFAQKKKITLVVGMLSSHAGVFF